VTSKSGQMFGQFEHKANYGAIWRGYCNKVILNR
jgi:hypothetical protein